MEEHEVNPNSFHHHFVKEKDFHVPVNVKALPSSEATHGYDLFGFI